MEKAFILNTVTSNSVDVICITERQGEKIVLFSNVYREIKGSEAEKLARFLAEKENQA